MAKKFVMQLTTSAGTVELVAQRAKSLHEALQVFARKVPAIDVSDDVSVTINSIDRSLAYTPPNITLTDSKPVNPPADFDSLLRPLDLTSPCYQIRLKMLCRVISTLPSFGALTLTPYYQMLLEIYKAEQTALDNPGKPSVVQQQLLDLIQKYIKENNITTLT